MAAHADHHVAVRKVEAGDRTVTAAGVVAGDDRVVELARMLSGHPDSPAAQRHAQELLDTARH